MVLRIPSVTYKEFLNDIWEVGIDKEEMELVDLPDMEPVPTYSQTVIVQPIPFFDNRVGFISDYYKTLLGYSSSIGTFVSGDLVIHQLLSHFPLAQRFTMSTNIPIKEAKVNGLHITQNYLQQVQGFFNFTVDSVAGFEPLYNLTAGSTVVITDVIPFGIGG